MEKKPEVPLQKLFSQLEFLKEQLARSEARSGSDNIAVQSLRWQIAALEKPRAENPCW